MLDIVLNDLEFLSWNQSQEFFLWLVPLAFRWPKVSVMFVLNRTCFVLHEDADFLENSLGEESIWFPHFTPLS